tara:strand:- start:603 stop:920 length:318 start_codon:yes stop_codon:yes gene_type:complete
MSDTPQTNSIAYRGYNESAYIAEMTDLARTLERDLAAERAIVSRIWDQLGSLTYEQLKGRSIYDLVDELKAELATERARLDHIQEWGFDFLTRAAIDAAMKEDAK